MGVRKLETKEDVKMRIEVLGNLPWNTSREAVKKSVVWTVVEEYGSHVLFKAGSLYH